MLDLRYSVHKVLHSTGCRTTGSIFHILCKCQKDTHILFCAIFCILSRLKSENNLPAHHALPPIPCNRAKVGAHIDFHNGSRWGAAAAFQARHTAPSRSAGWSFAAAGQDRTHQLIRPALGAEEIAQRKATKASPPSAAVSHWASCSTCGWVPTMTSAPPVCQILRQCALTVHNGVAVLYAPVHTHDHKVGLLVCWRTCLLDHIGRDEPVGGAWSCWLVCCSCRKGRRWSPR